MKKRVGEHSFSQAQLSKNPANATSFTTSSPGQGSRHLAKPPRLIQQVLEHYTTNSVSILHGAEH